MLHAIRDCLSAISVWRSLLPESLMAEFFSLELNKWILWLLKAGMEGGKSTRRSERMATFCWLQWHWRNDEVFKGVQLDLQQRLR